MLLKSRRPSWEINELVEKEGDCCWCVSTCGDEKGFRFAGMLDG